MIATGIQDCDLGRAWTDLWPFLKPAYELSPETVSLLGGIRAKDLQLWAIFDKNTAVAGIVTRLRVHTTSGELHCQIWLVGGSRLYQWAADFLAKVKDWARSEGCSAVVAAGVRHGWDRVAPKLGFIKAHIDGPDQYWAVRL